MILAIALIATLTANTSRVEVQDTLPGVVPGARVWSIARSYSIEEVATWRPEAIVDGQIRSPAWLLRLSQSDKNRHYRLCACNDAVCTPWREEANVVCSSWLGPDGCATNLFPEVP